MILLNPRHCVVRLCGWLQRRGWALITGNQPRSKERPEGRLKAVISLHKFSTPCRCWVAGWPSKSESRLVPGKKASWSPTSNISESRWTKLQEIINLHIGSFIALDKLNRRRHQGCREQKLKWESNTEMWFKFTRRNKTKKRVHDRLTVGIVSNFHLFQRMLRSYRRLDCMHLHCHWKPWSEC